MRYPLPLESGSQCRVLEGFGKTICARLDDKLREHRGRQSTDLAISPVKRPSGQIPLRVRKESPSKKFPKTSPLRQENLSVVKNQEEEDLELALSLSQQEAAEQKRNEEEDFELALRLSQSSHNDEVENDYQFALQLSQNQSGEDAPEEQQNDEQSQEESDREFAKRLHEELNKSPDPRPSDRQLQSPPRRKFKFDLCQEASIHDSPNHYSDDELPDIDFPPDSPRRPQNKAVADLVTVNRKKPAHNISEVSDEEADSDQGSSKTEGLDLEAILAGDPVMNMRRYEKKTKGKQESRVKSPGSSQKKEYIPRKGSGAYAVLRTLYEEIRKESYRGYLTKKELTESAQPLANQSFVMANNKTEHYTAWSGVSNLIKHKLVIKWSNPAKFNITEKGRLLAGKIIASEEDGDVSGRDTEQSGALKRKRGTSPVSPGQVQEQVRKERLEKFDRGRTETNRCLFGAEDDEQLRRALELSKLEAQQKQPSTSHSQISYSNFDLGDTFNLSDWNPETENEGQVGLKTKSSSEQGEAGGSAQDDGEGEAPLSLKLYQNFQRLASASAPTSDSHQPDFVFQAGTYEVILCVDNTETAGGGFGGRKTLKEETARHLKNCNVPHDRRNLNLGDFLWVARERLEQNPRQYQQRPRELVLPYIIERKRLDDLWQSVKDGRYEEQKFRMKNCGVTNLYYLVENYQVKREWWGRAGASGAYVTPDSIEQAVANTAVQGGFTVKRTDDQKETIEYLTMMTRLLTKKYSGRSLTSCTQADIDNGLVGQRDTTLLTFQEFNDSTKKTKEMTVGEVWGKMLLRLKGLSVEMAQAIISQYPTPTSLVRAYKACSTAQERIKLLTAMSYGMENKRKIPKTVSEALMKVWSLPSF